MEYKVIWKISNYVVTTIEEKISDCISIEEALEKAKERVNSKGKKIKTENLIDEMKIVEVKEIY